MARRRERGGGRKREAGRGRGARARGASPGTPPGRPVAPDIQPAPRGLGGLVDPAWGAIRYPPGGFSARDFAAFVETLVEAGAREHYADAALYDYEYRRRRADVTFYRELARRRGADRILELGAGSGRVTVPLARDGRSVVAVDRSPAMLDRLRDRLGRLPRAVAARITPVAGDLRSFSVGGRFPLAIAAFNVLEHLYTRAEVTACLQRIAAHLEGGGAFAFDVQLPDLAWLTRDASRRWAKTRFTDPTTGRTMYYSTNHDYDPVSQIAMIRLYYEPADEGAEEPAGGDIDELAGEETDESGEGTDESGEGTDESAGGITDDLTGEGPPAGRGADKPGRPGPPTPRANRRAATRGDRQTATRVVQLSQRKFFPAELEALVAHAGFRVTERYGDFSFRPLDGTAESQVLVCEPAPPRGRSRALAR